jgi:uncharacterized membrane protein
MSTTPPAPGRTKKPTRLPLLIVSVVLLGLFLWAFIRGTWADAAPNNPKSSAEGVTRQLYRDPDGEVYVRSAIVIDAPAAKVWGVVRDYANHPRFLPHVKSLEVQSKDGDRVHLTGVAHSAIWGDWPFAMDVVHKVDPDKEYSASWDQPGGILTVNRGKWTVTALGPKQTLVELALHWETRGYASFLLRNLLLNRLPSMLQGLRDEVNRREKGV